MASILSRIISSTMAICWSMEVSLAPVLTVSSIPNSASALPRPLLHVDEEGVGERFHHEADPLLGGGWGRGALFHGWARTLLFAFPPWPHAARTTRQRKREEPLGDLFHEVSSCMDEFITRRIGLIVRRPVKLDAAAAGPSLCPAFGAISDRRGFRPAAPGLPSSRWPGSCRYPIQVSCRPYGEWNPCNIARGTGKAHFPPARR